MTPPPHSFKTVQVVLDGELDLASKDALSRQLRAAEKADVAIIDLSRVTYLDSSALSCLIDVKKRMTESGRAGIVKLVGATGRITKILRLCSLDLLFVIEEAPAI